MEHWFSKKSKIKNNNELQIGGLYLQPVIHLDIHSDHIDSNYYDMYLCSHFCHFSESKHLKYCIQATAKNKSTLLGLCYTYICIWKNIWSCTKFKHRTLNIFHLFYFRLSCLFSLRQLDSPLFLFLLVVTEVARGYLFLQQPKRQVIMCLKCTEFLPHPSY